ncbi:MAG: hypothetical protein M1817_004143 [Caeruleum heppii]|nr:MAG: hypothetical protein M1817_004143 [Caeruleum heppii]
MARCIGLTSRWLVLVLALFSCLVQARHLPPLASPEDLDYPGNGTQNLNIRVSALEKRNEAILPALLVHNYYRISRDVISYLLVAVFERRPEAETADSLEFAYNQYHARLMFSRIVQEALARRRENPHAYYSGWQPHDTAPNGFRGEIYDFPVDGHSPPFVSWYVIQEIVRQLLRFLAARELGFDGQVDVQITMEGHQAPMMGMTFSRVRTARRPSLISLASKGISFFGYCFGCNAKVVESFPSNPKIKLVG